MPRAFVPIGASANIVLPSYKPDPSGLASYHVISDTQDIEASAPDFDRLRDIVRVEICGVEVPNSRCSSKKFWMNDATSRCMINVLQINDNGDVAPGDINFVVRQSCSCVPTVRYNGLWAPNNDNGFAANGLLVQIGGLLSTAWEVQMEIVPNVQNPNPNGYSIVLEFILDRLGDNNQAIRGPLTTGTLLPAFP